MLQPRLDGIVIQHKRLHLTAVDAPVAREIYDNRFAGLAGIGHAFFVVIEYLAALYLHRRRKSRNGFYRRTPKTGDKITGESDRRYNNDSADNLARHGHAPYIPKQVDADAGETSDPDSDEKPSRQNPPPVRHIGNREELKRQRQLEESQYHFETRHPVAGLWSLFQPLREHGK